MTKIFPCKGIFLLDRSEDAGTKYFRQTSFLLKKSSRNVRRHCLEPKYVCTRPGLHTASFWNITIQWTSHDDLTEKYFFFPLEKTR